MRPLVIELYAGSFGWGAGFVAEGWRSIGFDILHEPYHGPVPEHCQLVLEDVLHIHGSRFKDANAIVASPPCQKYSYMAMPWTRAKALAAWYRGEVTMRVIERDGKIVDEMVPVEDPADIQRFAEERQTRLNALFNACFRIQREASEAGGRYIPMVVENVKGAQPWVGRARWHYGSYYLWGDVPALMPFASGRKVLNKYAGPGSWKNEHGEDWRARNNTMRQELLKQGPLPPWVDEFGLLGESDPHGRKNNGGSWFNQAHNTVLGQNPVNGQKTSGLIQQRDGHGHTRHLTNQCEHDAVKIQGIGFSGYGKPGYKAQGFNVTAAQRYREGLKGQDACADGIKQHGSGPEWFDRGITKHSSRSDSRKAASAQIAKIPFGLASWIAKCLYPC